MIGGAALGRIWDGFGLDFSSPESPMVSPERISKIYLKIIYNKDVNANNASTSHVLE